MIIRPQRDLTDPPEQLSKTRIATQVGAQDQGVDKESQSMPSVSTRVRPAIGVPTTRSFLACVAVEQRLESRHERHEERDPFLLAQRLERCREGGREHQRLPRSLKGLDGRAWPVSRQLQNREIIAQLLFPVGKLCFQYFTLEPLALPDRKIAVLERKSRK